MREKASLSEIPAVRRARVRVLVRVCINVIVGVCFVEGRERRILHEKAVKLEEPYKPYGGQFLEFCSIF